MSTCPSCSSDGHPVWRAEGRSRHVVGRPDQPPHHDGRPPSASPGQRAVFDLENMAPSPASAGWRQDGPSGGAHGAGHAGQLVAHEADTWGRWVPAGIGPRRPRRRTPAGSPSPGGGFRRCISASDAGPAHENRETRVKTRKISTGASWRQRLYARLLARILSGRMRCRKSGGVLCWVRFGPQWPAGSGQPRHVRAPPCARLAQEPTPRVDDAMHTDSASTALETLTAPVTVLVGSFRRRQERIAATCLWLANGAPRDRRGPRRREALLPSQPAARTRCRRAAISSSWPQDDRFYADLPIVVPEVRGAVGRAMAAAGARHLRRGRRRRRSRVLGSIPGLDDPRSPTSSSSSTATALSPNRPTPSSGCCATSNGSPNCG